MHLQFRRSGGLFAGQPLVLEVDESELDPDAAAALRMALEGEGLARFAALPDQGVAPDAYQYDLRVRRGGDDISLRFDETRVPPELAPLIFALEERAEPKR